MPRFFNTTGPCDPERHFMLPPEARLPELLTLIERQEYFVVHAARQTGKTTAMRAFAQRLRGMGCAAVWATLEASQGVEAVASAEPLWMEAIRDGALDSLPGPPTLPPLTPFLRGAKGRRLQSWLRAWAATLPGTPIVLLLDEADVVSGDALVSFLRQLRAGFTDRGPGRFPTSVALVGMRDLRDYLTLVKRGIPVNPGSPFNIKSASLTLRNFTQGEVQTLYSQHTADTGQAVTAEAAERAFYWSQGQPFLVNALARLCVDILVPDRATPVDAAAMDEAKERLILDRTTHLDSLAERLKEPRVARVVKPILLGDEPFTVPYGTDDFEYTVDLGLVRRGPDGAEAANPIYREVLTRQLSYRLQEALVSPRFPWQTPAGHLDMPAIVEQFLRWWRTNAEAILPGADPSYLEALPHLAFMAFLQKIVNGGGTVTREFAAGRGALDLMVEYAGRRHVMELKRVPSAHRSLESVREDGIEQLASYLDTLGEKEGWLLVFDQRPGRSWDQRNWAEDLERNGRVLHLRGA